MLHVRLFGDTRVLDGTRMLGPGDFGGLKPRLILEALALQRGQQISKDRLADILWPDRPPPDHRATLESYVSLLRRRLQPGTPARQSVIRTVPRGYLLDHDAVRTDLDVFDDLVAQADRQTSADARRLLDRASALASKDLLNSPDEAPWAEPTRADYRQRAVRAALRAAELALQDHANDAAVRLAGRTLALDMLCEPGWRMVMRAHLAAGHRDSALRAYRSCRRLLARELGLEPAAETRAVLVDVVARNRATRPPRGPQGLRPGDRSTDLASVMDAALALFEHQRTGEYVGQVNDAVRIMAGLVRRAGR
ncbi:MAG TPA: BTAD domain-containing putative transcriptional regulator [Pseudonocardiaceae bacterium]|jgi:DNA-binding SARP family transcriptional activator|nr:BTAD domain-containing putative transcriptional regulator [Pseudonocardiaceae bacterium]